jgi:hypothetical protein
MDAVGKLALCLTEPRAMNTYWGVEVHLRAFLASETDFLFVLLAIRIKYIH